MLHGIVARKCPNCQSEDHSFFSHYTTKCDSLRALLKCITCHLVFSETSTTFLFNLKTPLSRIATILHSRSEGMSFNATCRTFHVGSHTLKNWEERFGELKHVLMAYALSHTFLEQIIEGDELYTKVGSNKAPFDSEGWTIMLMDRASRFIWELSCNKKDEDLFMQAIKRLSTVIAQTETVVLVTDGERQYSKILFDICYDLLKNGKPGRPKKVLQKGVGARVKNKGDQSHKRGPKRPKYQTPKAEHPETKQLLESSDIHANHVEAQNAAMRRRNSAYRRKTNTYAKNKNGLQRTLDTYWIFHNFIKKHYTTKVTPAVKMGIADSALTWEELFSLNLAS